MWNKLKERMNSTIQHKNIVLRNPNQSLLRCCRSLKKKDNKKDVNNVLFLTKHYMKDQSYIMSNLNLFSKITYQVIL